MIELEERLREGLGRLAEPVASRVELDAVIADGERLRRGRRTRGLLAAGATMVACGLAGAALLAGTPGSRVIATPAAPSPSVSAVPSHAPTVAPSEGAKVTLTFDSRDDPLMGAVGMAKVTVVRPDNKAPGVVVSGTTKNGDKVEMQGSATVDAPFLAKLTDRTWVLVTAVKPVRAEGAVNGGITPGQTYPLEDFGVAVVSGEPGLPLAGFIWQDDQGRAWNDRGERVPSAEVVLDGRTYRFAHDEQLRVACSGEVRSQDFDAECSWLNGELSETGRDRSVGGVWEDRAFIVLPEGASGAEPGEQSGCTSATANLDPGGRTLLLLVCSGSGGGEGQLPSVRYVDAHGKEQVYSP
jgi:hypothetical protein